MTNRKMSGLAFASATIILVSSIAYGRVAPSPALSPAVQAAPAKPAVAAARTKAKPAKAAPAKTAAAPAAAVVATAQPAAAAPATADAAPVDAAWLQFSGWKRYHANCSVCHGPDGLGGTFAPALATSLKTMDHDQFLDTVVNGKENSQLAMPAFGADPNVMCYIEDIYIYLKARSDEKMGRGRPTPQPTKPKDFAEAETACMGA